MRLKKTPGEGGSEFDFFELTQLSLQGYSSVTSPVFKTTGRFVLLNYAYFSNATHIPDIMRRKLNDATRYQETPGEPDAKRASTVHRRADRHSDSPDPNWV